MNSMLSKLAIILILVLGVLGFLFYQKNLKVQQQLQQEILSLRQQVKGQDVALEIQDNKIQEQTKAIEDIPNKLVQADQETLNASYLAQGFQAISVFKVHIAEFYMMNGKFPENNKDLRLAEPTEFATDIIRSVSVGQGGKVIIVYNEKSGIDNGAISFTPTDKNYQLHWKCTTNDFKKIQRFIPQCYYGK